MRRFTLRSPLALLLMFLISLMFIGRVVSGTVWSTTDSKLVKWMEKFGKQIVKRDFGGLYRRGDVVDD